MNGKNGQNAKLIGARFRSARSLVPDLNRKTFCERHDINRYTMQSWENGLHVSKGKNLEKFLQALAKEGVSCSAEWLIEGSGEPARVFTHSQEISSEDNDLSHEHKTDAFLDRTLVFQSITKLYQDQGQKLELCKIQDEAMAPKFRTNDWVLGVEVTDHILLNQKFCIIRLSGEQKLVRKLIVLKDRLMLIALDERQPIIYLPLESELFQIIWHYIEQ